MTRTSGKSSGEKVKFTTTAIAMAAGFAVTALALVVPAAAAPTGDGNAEETISRLEAEGNRVIVNRLDATALSDTDVVAVRQGPPIRQYVWDAQGDRRIQATVGNVYFVDVE